MSEHETTHFGFQNVPVGEKVRRVGAVFSSVARRYDIMNDLMSGGLHRRWKDAMVDWLAPRAGMKILDVAGGTGDIAFRIVDRTKGAANVTVCDINPDMLSVGRDRAIDRGYLDNPAWVVGDAENLPLPAESVDAYTCAFGLRNVTRLDLALSEAARVLKPGGRFLALEFSAVEDQALAKAYDLYSFAILPRLGKYVAKDEAAYRYLAESIRKFPDQRKFASMIESAGLGRVNYRNLTRGVVALHSGWKI